MEQKRGAVWFFLSVLALAAAQTPPRLNIPGAVLVGKQPAYRPQRISQPFPRPPPPRPVFEEAEEEEPAAAGQGGGASQFLDDEVNKLGLAALQSAVRQQDEEERAETEAPRPVQFRPERPLPVLRQDIREGGGGGQGPARQALRQQPQQAVRQQAGRQQLREEPRLQQPVRVQQQQARPAPPPQAAFRQTSAQRVPAQRAPPTEYPEDDELPRRRKPVVQILRKYRVDNEDGSITWGYENEDGTFKEETLGADCMIRGKYGYVDPDGVRREYSYEAGNKCDEPDEEEVAEQLANQQPQQGGGGGGKQFLAPPPRKQYRPQ